ncbi:MAG: hypothetical protein K6A38_10965 [Lachnospiraceae bacterium]|nr:hypothetical protein [Lachnospiraceae bacterium]
MAFENLKTYGELGSIGLATPGGGEVIAAELFKWLHPDISISVSPTKIDTLSPEGLKVFSERVIENMQFYRDYDPVDVVYLSCTSGSQAGGPGYDRYLCEEIKKAANAKAGYTTTTAVLKALRLVNAKKLSVVTPYPNDVNEMEKEYLESEGFTVLNINGIKTADPRNPNLITKITPKTIYEFALEHTDPEADVLFLSCTGLLALDIIETLEKDLNIPVINSNQSTIWLIGEHFGKHSAKAEHLGSIFKLGTGVIDK